MERGMKAAFLLSMLVVASADRALLNKPSGGALHGVAFTASYLDSTPDVVKSNYYITNGNGTWTYSAYSTPSNTQYAAINSAFSAAGLYTGSVPTTSTTLSDVTGSAYVNMAQGLTAVVFPSKNLGVAVGAADGSITTTGSPSILITLDGALTWMAVTGLPTYTLADPAAGDPATAAWPTPGVVIPDLTSVFFASKSLGWAAGGSVGNALTLMYPDSATTISTTPYSSQGTILMTTNGGTVWSACVVAPSDALANTAPIPGVLTSIMSDSAGKNVYAVGAPGTAVAPASGDSWSLAKADDITAAPLSYGTILYSANSGASWVTQVAPAVANWDYGFMSVYVQKGTTAWAVGGNIYTPTDTASSYGVIAGTFNGGFSWALLSYPGVADGKAPTFTTIAYNGKTAWVGGFAATTGYYPSKPSGTSSTVSSVTTWTVAGSVYTLLSSVDGKTFLPVPATALPAGFVFTNTNDDFANWPSGAGGKNIFGITWDNGNRGYIFGAGFIMSTQNGGSTWVYETPNSLATADPALNVVAIGNVPTSY